MHCPIYKATMRSTQCIEYQKRARGDSLPKKSIYTHPSDGSVLWAIKYKPCLTCDVGRQIRKNGGDDSDVEAKIAQANETAARQLKRCSTCKLEKPLADFGRNRSTKDGFSLNCRACKYAQQKKSYQFLKHGRIMTANMAPDIDQIAPNNKEDSMTNKAIQENVDQKQSVNIASNINTNNITDAISCNPVDNPPQRRKLTDEEKKKITDWGVAAPDYLPVERTPESTQTHAPRTCRNCGHSGPDPDFYKTGSQGYTNVCRKCAAEKRARTIQDQKAAGPTAPPQLPAHCVVLDFSEHPELLENLRQTAKMNFRTLSNEILFRVVKNETI